MKGFLFRRSMCAAAVMAAATGLGACSQGQPAPAEPRSATQAAAAPDSRFGPSLSRLITDDSRLEQTSSARRQRVVPGELLVKFKSRATNTGIAATLNSVSFRSVRAYRSVPGLRHVKLAPGLDAQTARAAFEQQADVEYVEPNFIVSIDAIPNDPEFPRLWGLHNTGQTGGMSTANPDIDAPDAWDITTGSSDIVVAVIDTGVDYRHEDLAANIFRNGADCNADGIDSDTNGYIDDCHGIDPANDDADPMDDSGHGTHVSGTIGAVGNNGIGITGVAWNVRILPCKFISAEGFGTISDAITCLDYVAAMRDRGVNIVASNNSCVIAAQRQRGILFIAAAGNDMLDNDLLPHYPCAYDLANIICVAATYDALSKFSNYGAGTVHLGAPGQTILSTTPGNSYASFDGTSMAAPHVSGTIALLKAQDITRDWRALKNLVLAGSVPPTEYQIPTITGKRLNAARAMSCANSVVLARLRPPVFEALTRAVGDTVPLKALHINCAVPNGPVSVTVSPSGEIVTLADNGSGNDEVAGDGIYAGEWTAYSAGTFTLSFPEPETEKVTVNVDPLLKRGFPTRILNYDLFGRVGSPEGGLLAGNIDGDPTLEILTTGYWEGPLYAWNHDGSGVLGWPVFDVFGAAHAALGEFDGDRFSSEIASMYFFTGMRLYSGNGTLLPGWPQFSMITIPPATIDLDGDGRDEVIGYPARHADGSVVNPDVHIPVLGPPSLSFPGAVAVADLDADRLPDFVVGDDNSVTASNARGLIPGFPANAKLPNRGGTVFPVVGDVDADGKPEIVIATGVHNQGFSTLRVLVFSSTGVLERTFAATSPIGTRLPALADLDADGVPEIIVPDSKWLHAWKGDGRVMPGFPVSLGSDDFGGVAGAVIGDVDGDQRPDVVALTSFFTTSGPPGTFPAGRLHIFDSGGSPLAGFPKVIPSSGNTTPVIADIDLDGRNDLIVATTPDFGDREGLFAYDLLGPGPYGPIEWGQYMEGPSRRGYYELGKNLPNHAFLTIQAHGEGRVTASDGLINCGADCIERYPKGASVNLTASPGTGASFGSWLGACASQGNPCTVSVQQYTSVAADFDSPLSVVLTGTGAGTVTSSPAGISCPSDCSEVYDARTIVTLTAAASPNHGFDGWTGACSGAATTCSVTIDAAKSVTAKFVRERRLTVAKAGAGRGAVTSTPAGIDCGAACAADFAPDAVVTLTVTPAPDSYFQGWTEPCPSFLANPCTVTMEETRT